MRLTTTQRTPQQVLGKTGSRDGGAFAKFALAYLAFIRDVDFDEPDAAFDLLDAASGCVALL
jgi:hypothetical protein